MSPYAGAKPNFALRAGCNVLHDAVAVLVTSGERDEDVEGLRCERRIGTRAV